MKCRVCKCTYERACANGCDWVRGEGNLCTNCAWIVEVMRWYREVAYRFSLSGLMREVDRPAFISRVRKPVVQDISKRRAAGGPS